MGKLVKEIVGLVCEIPRDLCKKEFYTGLLGFLWVLAKAWIVIAIFSMLIGQITKTGHGDAEYQKAHSYQGFGG